MRWDEYVEASRRLAEIRRQEASRQAQAQKRATTGRAAIEQLRQRLDAQADHLVNVAMRLRETRPAVGGAARTGLIDVDEALRRAWQAIDQADAEVRQAEERGMRPVLLPNLSPNGRSVLVYSAATACLWLVSCGLFTFSPQSGGASVGLLFVVDVRPSGYRVLRRLSRALDLWAAPRAIRWSGALLGSTRRADLLRGHGPGLDLVRSGIGAAVAPAAESGRHRVGSSL